MGDLPSRYQSRASNAHGLMDGAKMPLLSRRDGSLPNEKTLPVAIPCTRVVWIGGIPAMCYGADKQPR
jgi:hypothetical protein